MHIIKRYSMWVESFAKIYDKLDKKVAWDVWTDVNNWTKWHDDLEFTKMEEDFEVGSHFFLKPKGGPKLKIVLTEVEEGHKFTDCTNFIGAKMYVTHIIEELEDKSLRLTNQVVVTGIMGWLWVFLVAKKVAASIEEEMDASVEYMRKQK